MMRLIEILSLKLDTPPWNAFSRMLVGFGLISSYDLVCRGRCPAWTILPFFVVTLLALRAIPLVIRKALPFSKEAQAVWKARRWLARNHDSYQWRKLFWMGLGLALGIGVFRNADQYQMALAGLCILGGAIGLVTWMNVARRLSSASSPQ